MTVETVLSELQSEIHRGSKVVTGVRIDGRVLLSGWQRRQQLNVPVSSVNHLELRVDEPKNATANMLADAENLLNNLIVGAEELARKFRIGDEVIANNELAEYFENLKLVASALDMASRQIAENPAGKSLRPQAEAAANSLLPLLDRIYKAQAAGDYIAIADEIEYEFPVQMAEWRELIRKFNRDADKA
jgi:hypothetical protein